MQRSVRERKQGHAYNGQYIVEATAGGPVIRNGVRVCTMVVRRTEIRGIKHHGVTAGLFRYFDVMMRFNAFRRMRMQEALIACRAEELVSMVHCDMQRHCDHMRGHEQGGKQYVQWANHTMILGEARRACQYTSQLWPCVPIWTGTISPMCPQAFGGCAARCWSKKCSINDLV